MHITPSMQQYLELKKQYQDCILLFQMGDFYETFFDDAKIISKELNIILTSREKKNPIPMAGFPVKAIDSYLPKLIKKGYKVAIAEQIEDPKLAKGLVKRKVIEVVTRSTLLDDDINNITIPKQTASIVVNNKIITIAIGNISGNTITITKINQKDIRDYLLTQKVTEIVSSNIKNVSNIQIDNIPITAIKPIALPKMVQYLLQHFNKPNLMAIGLEEDEYDLQAVYLLLKYFEILKNRPAKNISKIQYQTYEKRIYLDSTTLKNLEILESLNNNPTLFKVLNYTKTPMGARFLYKNLRNPLKDKEEIQLRLKLIQSLIKQKNILNQIQVLLNNIVDIEKISSLITFNKIKPQQIIKLKESLVNANKLIVLINRTPELKAINKIISSPENIINIIENITYYINPNYDRLTEGFIINEQSFPKIKKLRDIVYNTQNILETYKEEIAKEFGLERLKFGFNKVYGYFFEVPKTQKHKLPDEFVQKQTLVNSIRFTTPKLQALEQKIQTAEEELLLLEAKLYQQLLNKLKIYLRDLYEIANYIAYIDFISNGAYIAIRQNYTKPKITNKKTTKIIKGRHPVVERITGEFIPNSINLNDEKTFIILTGPNMGGKSTFIRQIALIQLIAQIGYYIPAQRGILSIKDRIFARVGASDMISKNMSTFMVEMSEVANIITNATEDSLIIIDELGRGTSTLEGISIAQAISEYLITVVKAHTLLTTHYYELTQLEKQYPNVQNLKVEVYEDGNTVVFLHTIQKGAAEKSYGIHIAKMVNLPDSITKRATNILKTLNQNVLPIKLRNTTKTNGYQSSTIINHQTQLPIQIENNSICQRLIKKLKKLEIEKTTPLKALEFLNELQKVIIK